MTTTPRQRALAALRSVKQLPPHERDALLATKAAVNRQVLTRNMQAYLEACLIADDGGLPPFSMQEFTDSLADALMYVGKQKGLGVAVIQTLVIELQDRINQTSR